jgi:hypothetical protein
MSGEFEAAGAMATAGLVAGVIEGREGGPPREGACLNCGAPLAGKFCAQCGQNANAHRSLSHVAQEFLHGLFQFDTKAWRTLPMVIFRPGTLTRNYVYGKRARYISPLATFLLCIFLTFFVFSLIGEDGVNITRNPASVEDLAEARATLETAQAELAAAEAEAGADAPDAPALEIARTAVERTQIQVERIERQLAAQQAAQAEGEAPAPVEEESWQDDLREAVDAGGVNINLGHPYLNERALNSLRNPDLALYKIQEAAAQFSFLLAPLSLPFIALLFLWRRGLTFYDHVVYALYALSFASLLFVTLMVGGATLDENAWMMAILANVLLLIALPVHTYFHLKGAYALGWWSAAWRTVFMLIFAAIIMTIFLVIIVILGLAG